MTSHTPNPMRVLIVDDEPIARRSLRVLLEHERQAEIVGEAGDGLEALAWIQRGVVDVVLLDVQMPGLSGVEVVRQIPKERMPWVIFVTAYDRFAVQAFEAHAVDYVLKPVESERLSDALQRAREAMEGQAARETLDGLLQVMHAAGHTSAPAPARDESLALPLDGGVVRVPFGEVRRVEADAQSCIVFTRGEMHRVRRPLAEVERQLGHAQFLRIHRSHIVALAEVERLERGPGGVGTLVLRGGDSIPVSRSRFPAVRSRLDE